MLYVVFRNGASRWALPATEVVEVIPLVLLEQVPFAPPPVRGFFTYRGEVVVAVDVSVLSGGPPAADLLSTRVLVARTGPDSALVGLVAEKVTETLSISAGSPHPALSLPDAPWIDGVLPGPDGIVPCLRVADIVPKELLGLLKTAPEEAR